MVQDFSLGTVDVASTPLQRMEEYLQSRGKRMTHQRRTLVEQVFSHHDHFDAEDLCAQLKRVLGTRKVSRPTVYRTLAEMVDAGLLVKMDLNGRAVYEHGYGYPPHDHLHCMKCNKLIEFKSDELAAICEAVARQHQFRVRDHRMLVSGVCADCQRASLRPQRRIDRI
jgi:Fur family transcriptional regulator, ferric uptake regulator